MKIIGLSFTKILAERSLESVGNHGDIGISFDSIKKEDIDFVKKEDAYNLAFTFKVDYKDGEEVKSTISLQGRIIMLLSSSELKGIKKDLDIKSIPDSIKNTLFNVILNKGLIKSVSLADELGLPSPVPMPRASLKEKEDKK